MINNKASLYRKPTCNKLEHYIKTQLTQQCACTVFRRQLLRAFNYKASRVQQKFLHPTYMPINNTFFQQIMEFQSRLSEQYHVYSRIIENV